MGLLGDCECLNTYPADTLNITKYGLNRITLNVSGEGENYTSGGVKEMYNLNGSHRINGFVQAYPGSFNRPPLNFQNVLNTSQTATGSLVYEEKCYYSGTLELPQSDGTVNLWGRISSGTTIKGVAYIDDPEEGALQWTLNANNNTLAFVNGPRYSYSANATPLLPACTYGVGDWIQAFPQPFWKLPTSYDVGGLTCTPRPNAFYEGCGFAVGFSFYGWTDDPDDPNDSIQFQLRHDGFMNVLTSFCGDCQVCFYEDDIVNDPHDYLGTSTFYIDQTVGGNCFGQVPATLTVEFAGW